MSISHVSLNEMIDYIKAQTYVSDEWLTWFIDSFEIRTEANSQGEVNKWTTHRQPSKRTKEDDDALDLTVWKTKKGYLLTITGSLHRLANEIICNRRISHIDITHKQLIIAIDHFCLKYRLTDEDTQIIRCEYSINAILKKLVADFMKENVYLQNYKEREINNTYSGTGRKILYKVNETETTLYDKGREANVSANILRLEVQTATSKESRKFGIKNLACLKNPQVLKAMNDELCRRIDEIQIIDYYDSSTLTESEIKYIETFTIKKKLNKHTNPKNKPPRPEQTVRNHKRKFEAFIKHKNLDTLKSEIINQIKEKGQQEWRISEGGKNEPTWRESAGGLNIENQETLITANGGNRYIRIQPKPPITITKASKITGVNITDQPYPNLEDNLNVNPLRIIDPETGKKTWQYPADIEHLPNDHPKKKKYRNIESNTRNNTRRKYIKIFAQHKHGMFRELAVEIPLKDYQLLSQLKNTDYDILKEQNYKII